VEKMVTKPRSPNRNDYFRSASNDPSLQAIMAELDRCSVSQDNGTWGCVGCAEFSKCWRLCEMMINISVRHLLRDSEVMIFNKRWTNIQGRLNNGQY